MEDLSCAIKDHLATFAYTCGEPIRLSDLLMKADTWQEQQGTGEFHRIKHLQDMGDAFREKLQDGERWRGRPSRKFELAERRNPEIRTAPLRATLAFCINSSTPRRWSSFEAYSGHRFF